MKINTAMTNLKGSRTDEEMSTLINSLGGSFAHGVKMSLIGKGNETLETVVQASELLTEAEKTQFLTDIT